jgi:hypothetical protein
MPIHVRERTAGKHELRVTHALLDEPFYKTFDDPEEAKRTGKRALIELQKGKVPTWLVRKKLTGTITIAQAIRAYGQIRAIPFSADNLYDTLINEVGSTPVAELDYQWVERWITSMKRRTDPDQPLAPGTNGETFSDAASPLQTPERQARSEATQSYERSNAHI